jgi:hypothetical protein
MDIETTRELDRLRRGFDHALDEVRFATSDDQRLIAWRKVQTLGWELNAVLPTQAGVR